MWQRQIPAEDGNGPAHRNGIAPVPRKGELEEAAPSCITAHSSRSRTELRRLATVARHYLEAAGRRRTGLPAWNDNGNRRIALDAARSKKGNNSELRSSLPINTREFLRAVRVSRHSLYAQAPFILSAFGAKQYSVESPVCEKRALLDLRCQQKRNSAWRWWRQYTRGRELALFQNCRSYWIGNLNQWKLLKLSCGS